MNVLEASKFRKALDTFNFSWRTFLFFSFFFSGQGRERSSPKCQERGVYVFNQNRKRGDVGGGGQSGPGACGELFFFWGGGGG